MATTSNFITISSSPAPTQSKLPPSSHRLPTISASDALQDIQGKGPPTVPTCLSDLDEFLASATPPAQGGLERGKTTELWGPVGSGKTAIVLQAAVSELLRGNKVIWIDAATTLNAHRLRCSLETRIRAHTGTPAADSGAATLLRSLLHYTVPSLSHLLALILHPRAGFPAEGTSLMVVDGFNTVMDIDYPRVLFASSGRTEPQKWQAGRRYAVLGTFIASLNKLVVLNDIAAVVTTGCASRMRSDSGLGSALVPGVGGHEWDHGVWNRLVVLRDFGTRLVGVQKHRGRSLISREEIGETGRPFGFTIDKYGAVQPQKGGTSEAIDKARPKILSSPRKGRKRPFDEVADSEGEDVDEYGWAETDEDAFVDTVPDQPEPAGG